MLTYEEVADTASGGEKGVFSAQKSNEGCKLQDTCSSSGKDASGSGKHV
jgi:hypothetical protein